MKKGLCFGCYTNEHLPGWTVCFDCLWTYSRTYRRHSIPEMEYAIHVCAPFGTTHHKRDGYDLFRKGKKIKHGKTVKELKESVRKAVEKAIKKDQNRPCNPAFP